MIYKHYSIKPVALERDEPESDVPCGDCIQCCVQLTPYLTPAEFESGQYIYTFLTASDGVTPTIAIPRTEDGCIYLKDKKCTIYDRRPLACRQFDCRAGHYYKFADLVLEKFGIDISNKEE